MPRIIQVCSIDADGNYASLLEDYIEQHCAGSASFIKAYDTIPSGASTVPAADVIIFDPSHPDFEAVDAIDRVTKMFGEQVILIARLHETLSDMKSEELEISGVKLAFAAYDFEGIASYLNELSLERSAVRVHDRHTSATPLRPQPVHITLSIIDADPNCSSYLAKFFNERMPGLVMVDEALDGIPEPETVRHISRAVIFDPELDDFRHLVPALHKLREAFGEDTLLVAHSDAWHGNTRLREQLRRAGVFVGIRRSDLMSFLKLVDLLTQQESVDTIVRELGC
ncbi:MAG TPA: hypothetical protein VMU11_00810 [Verrucomicrobiae bacterium]|nr:hypothetical protein [Verrucomicrobiae bacterium]